MRQHLTPPFFIHLCSARRSEVLLAHVSFLFFAFFLIHHTW